MKYKLAFLLVLFYVYLPPIIMFDICKIEPWVPVRDEIDIAFDEAFDSVYQSMAQLAEQLAPLCDAFEKLTTDLSAWCESSAEALVNSFNDAWNGGEK